MDRFTVRQPKSLIYIGVVFAAVWCVMIVLMTLFPNDTAVWWVYLEFFAFFFLGIGMAVYSIRWKIEVSRDCLRITWGFGGETMVRISEIERIKPTLGGMSAYAGKRKLFTVGPECPGGAALLQNLQDAGVPFSQ